MRPDMSLSLAVPVSFVSVSQQQAFIGMGAFHLWQWHEFSGYMGVRVGLTQRRELVDNNARPSWNGYGYFGQTVAAVEVLLLGQIGLSVELAAQFGYRKLSGDISEWLILIVSPTGPDFRVGSNLQIHYYIQR